MNDSAITVPTSVEDNDGISLLDLLVPLAAGWRWLVFAPLLVGLVTYGITHFIAPVYTARTVFLPPQQQQSSAASALASLGALSGLAGVSGVRSPADQYIALMQSETVSDRIVDSFGLLKRYEVQYRVDARKALLKNVAISGGKKDGLIFVEVSDEDPAQAAAMANRYVEELRQLTNSLALSEAQQRRAFFESQLQTTRDRLAQAQIMLQASGFSPGALRAEPRAAAEGYARMRAEVTAAEVRLSTLRNTMTETAAEVRSQQATLAALRAQLASLEANLERPGAKSDEVSTDYVSRYREFKYQETLFDLFARQYEIARLDESREGSLIQVVDIAQTPERRSKPKRLLTALGTMALSFVLLAVWLLLRQWWRTSLSDPRSADSIARLRRAVSRG